MKLKSFKEGMKLKLDSYEVKQYENERVVDEVIVEQTPLPRSKFVLVYSPALLANILAPRKDLRTIEDN